MKIKLLKSVAGRFNDKPYSFSKGSTQDVAPELGKDLCQGGNAEVIATPKSKKTEKANSKIKTEKR